MGVEIFHRPDNTPRPVRIGGMTIQAWVEGQGEGGQQAPTKKTESGYKTTYTGTEPQMVTVRAKLDGNEVAQLDSIRRSPETVRVSVGPWYLDEAAIDNLIPVTTGSTPGAFETTIRLREVQVAAAGTARIYIPASASGTHTSSPSGGGPPKSASTSTANASSFAGGVPGSAADFGL